MLNNKLLNKLYVYNVIIKYQVLYNFRLVPINKFLSNKNLAVERKFNTETVFQIKILFWCTLFICGTYEFKESFLMSLQVDI